jgi:molybdate transport system ATP-binding protein
VISLNAHINRPSGFTLNVELEIKPNGITALYGPSGSGKSTILKLLAGLERGGIDDNIKLVSEGITWQDKDTFLVPEKRGTGLVFQQQQLFPHLTVEGNLQFAMKRQHTQTGLDLEQINEWLDITSLYAKKISQLSGGEAQRVAIARVLLNGARYILMDEPLGSIDSSSRSRILPYLDRLHKNLNIPMVYVSHSFEEITHLADYLYVLENGRIKIEGPMLELSSSLELNAGEGELAATVIECMVDKFDEQYGLTELAFEGTTIFVNADNPIPGNTVRVRVPARDVSIVLNKPIDTSILNVLEVEVISFSEYYGPSVLIKLRHKRQFILARITRKSLDSLKLQTGQMVYAQIKSVALINDSVSQ